MARGIGRNELTVPVDNRDLKTRTLNGILRTAGIRHDELADLL